MASNWTSFEDELHRHADLNSHNPCPSTTNTASPRPIHYSTTGKPCQPTPWRLSDDQKNYYIKNFGLIQSDYQATISGDQAREFFTRSGLPIRELSHIWELSDLDRDGELTLVEFCIAFHLVVLRIKMFQLPKALPQELLTSLFPSSTQQQGTGPMIASTNSQDRLSSVTTITSQTKQNGNTPTTNGTYGTSQNLISLDEEQSNYQSGSTSSKQKSHFNNNNSYQKHPKHPAHLTSYPQPPFSNPHISTNHSHHPSLSESISGSTIGHEFLESDTNWETFSEISSISSVSLVKMMPPGYFQDPNNILGAANNNIVRPQPIRVTPNKISAAGGYNPWHAQMQKLASLEEQESKNRTHSKELSKNSTKIIPNEITTPVATCSTNIPNKNNSNTSLHSNTYPVAQDTKSSSKVKLSPKEKAHDSSLSSRHSSRKRQNSTSSSLPMVNDMSICEKMVQEKRDLYERCIEEYRRDGNSSLSSSSESGEENTTSTSSKQLTKALINDKTTSVTISGDEDPLDDDQVNLVVSRNATLTHNSKELTWLKNTKSSQQSSSERSSSSEECSDVDSKSSVISEKKKQAKESVVPDGMVGVPEKIASMDGGSEGSSDHLNDVSDEESVLSKKLGNNSMNNLANFDSPMQSPSRQRATVIHSDSANALAYHKSSADSSEATSRRPMSVTDILPDPGVDLGLSSSTLKTSPVPTSSYVDTCSMVKTVLERNIRLQRMNTELQHELCSLKEDRIQLEVHIQRLTLSKSQTGSSTASNDSAKHDEGHAITSDQK